MLKLSELTMDLTLRDNTVNVFLKLLLEVIVRNLWDSTYSVRLERLSISQSETLNCLFSQLKDKFKSIAF